MKETQDFTEGYCDGIIADHWAQPWFYRGVVGGWEYIRGYALGRLDYFVMADATVDTAVQEAR